MSLGPVFKVAWGGRKIRMYMPGPRAYQMAALAQVGINSILKRVASGRGSNDQEMPPYSDKKGRPIYARYSMKQHKWVYFGPSTPSYKELQAGLGRHMRVLRGPGVGWTGTKAKGTYKRRKTENHMLDQIRVTSASPTQARIDITTADARVKARANEKRAPWWGFSGRDVRNMLEASRKIWGSNVVAFTAGFRGAGRAANSQVPVWMDPLGMGARASQPTIAGQMADRIQTLFGRAA